VCSLSRIIIKKAEASNNKYNATDVNGSNRWAYWGRRQSFAKTTCAHSRIGESPGVRPGACPQGNFPFIPSIRTPPSIFHHPLANYLNNTLCLKTFPFTFPRRNGFQRLISSSRDRAQQVVQRLVRINELFFLLLNKFRQLHLLIF